MAKDRDTIFALSSGRVPAAIAVIRISGPAARFALETMMGRLPEPRRASLAKLRKPGSDEILDEALVLWFPSPRSETGEDMAELQLHGGRAVVSTALATLGQLEGFRPAEAGEFTRRAFENGRLDLTAVEGLADLVAAETEAQRRQAFRQLKGALGNRTEQWRKQLVDALALIEASIDFSDEADVPTNLLGRTASLAVGLRDEIKAALADDRRGERLRDGYVIAIAGPPNVGKSSLLNRIARRDAAIVSPYAGTTRDIIEVHLDLEGLPVTLLDTAGIHDARDPVEQEGIRRARQRAADADLVLWVADPENRPEGLSRDADSPARKAMTFWLIENKCDLVDGGKYRAGEPDLGSPVQRCFTVSAKTGAGLERLLAALTEQARSSLHDVEPALVTRERHRIALSQTVAALDRAIEEAGTGQEELVAEELRLAARALGRLTGRVDVEDILDVVFRDFCIGK